MGAVSGMLGLGGGAGGTGFSGPQSANIVSPVTKEQAQASYDQNQQALQQQQAFLQAVQAQNGLQNQSNVYNQLAGIANGTGPNPALAQLAQATGANTANQAALMAGQRGSAQNVGLIARQAAQQGAANQQNAIGQAASLQAQQQLSALQNMGNLATTQAQQQANATGAYTTAAQQEQQNLLNSIANTNQANVSNQANINNANADLASRTMKMTGNVLSGLAGGIGSAMMLGSGGAAAPVVSPGVGRIGAMLAKAEGGAVEGPKSFVGQYLKGMIPATKMAEGGKVPALVSPGEHYLSPAAVKKVADGKTPAIKAGEKIPGKPKFPGNDYRNDIVPKTLQEGGIVIPNAVLQSADPHKEAAKFVAAVLAKQGKVAKK